MLFLGLLILRHLLFNLSRLKLDTRLSLLNLWFIRDKFIHIPLRLYVQYLFFMSLISSIGWHICGHLFPSPLRSRPRWHRCPFMFTRQTHLERILCRCRKGFFMSPSLILLSETEKANLQIRHFQTASTRFKRASEQGMRSGIYRTRMEGIRQLGDGTKYPSSLPPLA